MATPAELLSVRTEDGVLFRGARFQPYEETELAAFLTHGGWGNFYTGLGRFLVAAGLRLLKERGYRRLILIAHSYGAAKAAYS